MNIADYLISLLSEVGVKRIWGITGDSLNEFTKSIKNNELIEWIGVRHEEAAAFAAGGESQVSGQLSVCAGSCGGGNMHLMNGLYDCYRARTPVLAIAADIKSTEIGTDYFQETDPCQYFKECSVYCKRIYSLETAPIIIERAIREAQLNRSVSVLVISGDIASQSFEHPVPIVWQSTKMPILTPNNDDIHRASQYINQGQNITILCGMGCETSRDLVLELADKLKAPIVYALRGKESLGYNSPYDVGMTGYLGLNAGHKALREADTVIILGSRFPYRQYYPTNAKVIQIDRDSLALGTHTIISCGIQSEVGEALLHLLPLLKDRFERHFLNYSLELRRNDIKELNRQAQIEPLSTAIHPQMLFSMISKKATDDAIFTCDVGTPTLWSARFIAMNGQRKLIGSFSHGSMANALSQAMGAQTINHKRQVIALCGDGGLSMLLGELLTLRTYNLPVKIIVVNNYALDFVYLEMLGMHSPTDTTELQNPSFADIAKCCHIHSLVAMNPHELSSKIDELLNYDGPALLDVRVSPHELAYPSSNK
ncbi:ubiquinone-dependent pyruvate dehydrogenase [Photobacterium damselae]|nr:ubiquinone-dependent pyruvate dehydrogenase [Photobacterium damselae]